ncbi:MAG: energy-coupling factor ABC transporter permease [Propionibacteriaceae bacterium]|nr:energy-coupling factor ABC transporter permease [Propionibacteriaceae bacterium]
MHMTDALVSPVVGLAMDAVAIAVVAGTVARIKKDQFADKKVPLMGVAGALIFAGQMINFAIPGTGSSGHIGGGILLAGLVGAIPAFLTMTVVLTIQCLFFADGGLLALGCNIFNLGVIPCLIVFPLIFAPIIRGGTSRPRLTLASLLSVILALQLGALGVVLQTLFSGIVELPFTVFLATMLPIHLVIGVIEGIITAAVLGFVYMMRPEILSATHGPATAKTSKKLLVTLAVATVLIAGGLSWFASTNPDGLEWAVGRTTEKTGTTEPEGTTPIHQGAEEAQNTTAGFPGYSLPGNPDNPIGTPLSGLVGAGVTFLVAAGTGLTISGIKKRRRVKVDA